MTNKKTASKKIEEIDKEMGDVEVEELNSEKYIAKLNDDLSEQKKKAEEYYDSLKRNMADFDNFKKRITKERDSLHVSIVSDIIEALLPPIDNFEKALSHECQDEMFKQGMEMIYKQLKDLITKYGVEEIKAMGEVFNPEYHEAVMHISDEQYEEKEILEVLRKGYKLKGKVIRHSMVKVAN